MFDTDYFKTTEELSQEQWLLILWSIMTDLPVKEWNEFTHDLIYKDRFTSSHRVVDVIKEFSERCTNSIRKGQVLYRARVYHQDPLREFLSELFNNTTGKKASDNDINIGDYYYMHLAAIVMGVEKGSSQDNEIIYAYSKWKRKRFKGYNSTESGSPPADIGVAGRINPAKIRYLYLSEDCETAAYEVRPTIGQYVSVASFKIKEDIKLYDIAREITPQEGGGLETDYSLFNQIQQRFSEPNTGDSFRYLPTQYLGELIKHLGYDGLRFKSSLRNGGINVVLFDDKKCKVFRSDIIRVGDIRLKFENPEIYQLEELLKTDKSNGQ